MNATLAPHVITAENAHKITEWLCRRGGIAIWASINLGNPGASWMTPLNNAEGTPVTKPSWQSANTPDRIITNPAEVLVSNDVEVKRFRVAIRMGDNGLSFKVTDGGSRRIRKAIIRAGEGAYHAFDYGTQEAVILKPESLTPLLEFLKGSASAPPRAVSNQSGEIERSAE